MCVPNRAPGPSDKYNDVGIDGTLQLFDMGPHVFTLNGTYTHEHQDRAASFCDGRRCE
jgi:hypothetical protein